MLRPYKFALTWERRRLARRGTRILRVTHGRDARATSGRRDGGAPRLDNHPCPYLGAPHLAGGGTRILRVTHGRDARATSTTLPGWTSIPCE
jgi:hypothetical protein